MGIKQVELVPFQVTPITPAGKSVRVKAFTVARTETVAALKAMLPAQSSVIGVKVFGSVASDAGTSATVTVTITDHSGTVSSGAYDVKTNGAATGEITMSGLPNLESTPAQGDLKVSAVYAESGTASGTGGPWKVIVEYLE